MRVLFLLKLLSTLINVGYSSPAVPSDKSALHVVEAEGASKTLQY